MLNLCIHRRIKDWMEEMTIDDFARYMSKYIDNNGSADLIDRPYTRMLEIADQLKTGKKQQKDLRN